MTVPGQPTDALQTPVSVIVSFHIYALLWHASPHAQGILVFFLAVSSKFMLVKLWVKDAAGTFD